MKSNKRLVIERNYKLANLSGSSAEDVFMFMDGAPLHFDVSLLSNERFVTELNDLLMQEPAQYIKIRMEEIKIACKTCRLVFREELSNGICDLCTCAKEASKPKEVGLKKWL